MSYTGKLPRIIFFGRQQASNLRNLAAFFSCLFAHLSRLNSRIACKQVLRPLQKLTIATYPLALLLAASVFCPAAQANNDKREAELQVRAQFIYNFANFVEWPKDAFANAEAAIKVCLFGEVDFAPYLFAFTDTLIGSRPLKIQRANEIEEIRAGCHILYVGQDERVKLPTFWQQIHYIYVLSIGDRQGFADKGGIINILRAQDKMQFEVNIENALANGLFLDSDLLALARTIKRNTATGNPAAANSGPGNSGTGNSGTPSSTSGAITPASPSATTGKGN